MTNDLHYSRELLRLWVRNEELAWDLPRALVPHWRQLFYTAESETQVFFPDEPRSQQSVGKPSGSGSTWTYAGNEGGIPDSQ
jgi:hypothetical protein